MPAPVVTHVHLVGGSCSGKTTTMTRVADLLRAAGIRTITVAETASAVMANGINDLPHLDEDIGPAVQAAIGAAMHLHGDAARIMCAAAGGGVVLQDRGPLDAVPYSTWDLTNTAVAAAGGQLTDCTNGQRLILMLDAGPYETDSNPHRYETEDDARRKDNAIRELWNAGNPTHIAWMDTVDNRAHAVATLIADTHRAATASTALLTPASRTDCDPGTHTHGP
jgi:predicted ATPase